MPPEFALQFDGASTNKNILMLSYLALYVLFGVFRRARARCELEHHAHDIYDAFHAVHAGRVKSSTFFFMEELISIIEASHGTARDQAQLRPIAGHDVKVSCLWEVRDFWEWMAPGYTKVETREHALMNAAFSSFSAFRGYRDFLLELESDSTPANPRVGLWVKAYMTTSDYEFLGTIITMDSYQAITKDRSPTLQKRDIGACKTAREIEILKKYRAASKGMFSQQFPPERLADARAMASRDWDHFAGRKGELKPWARWLPHELAAELCKRGLRQGSEVHAVHGAQSVQSLQSDALGAEQQEASLMATLGPDVLPPALRQRMHGAADIFGFNRGERTLEMKVENKAPTDVEFQRRLIVPGSWVITRPALSSHWAKSSQKLRHLDVWLWRVVKVYKPEDALPGLAKPAAEFTYQAHLYHTKDGNNIEGPWEQTWDVVGPQLMRTEDEKDKRNKKKDKVERLTFNMKLKRLLPRNSRLRKKLSEQLAGKTLKKPKPTAKAESATEERPFALPLQAFLRPGNIIGGGFNRTGTGRLPRFVISYWQRRVQAAEQ